MRDDVADLFAEVDEDVRAERTRAAVRRWGPFGLASLVLLVALLGLWQWSVERGHARDARLSQMFFAAEAAGDAATPGAPDARALALFRSLDDAPVPGIRTLARLREAALLGDGGDDAAAIRVLDRVAGDAEAPARLRELATLLAVARLPAGSASRQAASKLAILEQPGAPFRPLALETGAMIDLAAGHTDATRRTLSLLVADGGAPTSLRERASTMLQALGPAVAANGSAAR